MDLWGRKVVGLRFFRPVAFWILRIEYTIADWNPVWMHAFSLGWHALVGLLVTHTMLGGFPVPAAPYLHDPTDPAFLSFAAIKSLHYLLGLFTYLPIIPIEGVAKLQVRFRRPLDDPAFHFYIGSRARFAYPLALTSGSQSHGPAD